MSVATEAGNEIRLHPGQQKTWESSARFVAMISGSGSGKTFMGPVWLYREIAKNPQGQFMVVAPSYKILMRATVPVLMKTFMGTDAEGRYNESKAQYALPTGGVIYCLSADKPKYLEGGQIDAAWLDEAGQMDRWTWVVMQARLGMKKGRCLITTTPYGRNWLYTEFYGRWLKGDPDYFCVQFDSVTNPYYPRSEFNRMKDTLSEREFAMRYKGEFMQLAGLVYPDLGRCVVSEPIYSAEDGDPLFGGIDPGWSAPLAALTAVKDSRGALHITREFYRKETLIRNVVEFLDPKAVYWVDPASRREMEELQLYLGANVQSGNSDVMPGIMKVNEYIRDRRLVIPESIAPQLVSEGAVYSFASERDEPRTGDAHHALDALRYMIMGVDASSSIDILFI